MKKAHVFKQGYSLRYRILPAVNLASESFDTELFVAKGSWFGEKKRAQANSFGASGRKELCVKEEERTHREDATHTCEAENSWKEALRSQRSR